MANIFGPIQDSHPCHSALEQRMECSGPGAVTLLSRTTCDTSWEIWRIDSCVEHELVGWCTCHSYELWSLLLSSSFLSGSGPVAWSPGTTLCHHSLLRSDRLETRNTEGAGLVSVVPNLANINTTEILELNIYSLALTALLTLLNSWRRIDLEQNIYWYSGWVQSSQVGREWQEEEPGTG